MDRLLLCISISKWALHMPFACQNNLLQHFHIFSSHKRKIRRESAKRKKRHTKKEKGVYQCLGTSVIAGWPPKSGWLWFVLFGALDLALGSCSNSNRRTCKKRNCLEEVTLSTWNLPQRLKLNVPRNPNLTQNQDDIYERRPMYSV